MVSLSIIYGLLVGSDTEPDWTELSKGLCVGWDIMIYINYNVLDNGNLAGTHTNAFLRQTINSVLNNY